MLCLRRHGKTVERSIPSGIVSNVDSEERRGIAVSVNSYRDVRRFIVVSPATFVVGAAEDRSVRKDAQ